MDSSQDFTSLQEAVQGALVSVTRTVNSVANEDLSFQRTADPSVGTELDRQSETILRLANDLLKSASKATGQKAPQLEDTDDVDIQWKGIVDVIDSLLEKSDSILDEYTGLVKRKDAPTAESGSLAKKSKPTPDKLGWNFRHANIAKPQNSFDFGPTNFDTGPWKPLLTSKPHASLPLAESIVTFHDEMNQTQYKHPYELEISTLEYPKRVFEKAEPILYQPVEKSAAVWVDTFDGVLAMLAELKEASEIAIDLEHHDYRTYIGLLSLMQISTRQKDWIVDTLKPWRRQLEVLNEVFADPTKIKVFHGASSDIIWLQRDLGLYIVGLFDTYWASVALAFSSKSLAYLLKRFVDFDADKKYQLADWRIRPLPDEMFYYARSDTHYLLYVYDMVRNELVDRSVRGDDEDDLIETVLQKSKEVSLLRYENPVYDADSGQGLRGWFNTLVKAAPLNGEQFAVYRAVHQWRDSVARTRDESPFYIMTQKTLMEVAKILPDDTMALWSIIGFQSHSLKPLLNDLHSLIQGARKSGAGGPTTLDFFRDGTILPAIKKGVAGSEKVTGEAHETTLPSAEKLRSDHSQLWGTVPIRTTRDMFASSAISLRIDAIPAPWAAYLGNTLETAMLEQATLPSAAKEIPQMDMIPLEEVTVQPARDEEFTLRKGRKQSLSNSEGGALLDQDSGESSEAELGETKYQAFKILDADGDEDAKARKKQTDSEAHPAEKVEDEANKSAKRQKKMARKAAKKAAIDAKRNAELSNPQSTGATEEADEQPFDYGKAQSVLHAQRAAKEDNLAKVFDPYKEKTMNAPKGVRASNYEKAVKKATFKK